MAPIIGKYTGGLPRANLAQATPSSNRAQPTPSSREPNRPDTPNENIYNPERWKLLINPDSIRWLKKPPGRHLDSVDYIPVGWMTWKETEKNYPTLDWLFRKEEKPLDQLWDPVSRNEHELTMPRAQRPPLDANLLTMLALERRPKYERREMNPLFEEYSRVPVRLPAKLSDEVMRRGPLETPPLLPLVAPSGDVVVLRGRQERRFRTSKVNRKRNLADYLDDTQLPSAQYHYPIDSPATSTFRFADGRVVSDIMKPGPLDEPNQIRGSAEAVEYGKVREKEEAPFIHPYTWEGMPAPLPPDFKPPTFDTSMTEAEKKAFDEWKAERERQRALRASKGIVDIREWGASERLQRTRFQKKGSRGTGFKVREKNPDDTFWHYEDMSDRDSHIHLHKKANPPDSENGDGEDDDLENGPEEPEEPESWGELPEEEDIDRDYAYEAYRQSLKQFLYEPEDPDEEEYVGTKVQLRDSENRLKRFWRQNREPKEKK
ncbi:hypothetical protein F5Y13DRAFT_197701 [Hypoxylon sp. FL1857]|nr:hypothetical protein F5Y13DRAFT_197701 [Hypoxylon sp. FL1857]